MSQKVCPSCNAPNDANATFCGSCGGPLSAGQPAAPAPNYQPPAPASYAPPSPPPAPNYQPPNPGNYAPPPQQNAYGQQQNPYGQQNGYQAAGYQQPGYQQQGYQQPGFQPGYADPDAVAAMHAAQAAGLVLPPGYAPAGFWIRFVAVIVDGIVMGITISVLSVVLALIGLAPLALLVYFFGGFAYLIYFWGSTGQTPGKKLLGLTVISSDGQPMSYGKAFLRLIGYFISGFILYIGFLMAAFDGAKRSLHDRIATTLVVKRF